MNTIISRRIPFASGVCLAALAAAAAPAHAQTAPASTTAPVISDEVETVVVTATGRAAAIQDVPIAVTAVTGATIQQAGITDVRNLQQVTPSYRVATGQSNSAGTSIAIRGIGTGADNPGFEAAVAVFIDGVYRNRSGVALSDLPQIERIEVLRGPQGTLFGRNTSAGAVSIVTAAPKFERNIYGKMDVGDYGLGSATLGFTGPLSETLAIRVEASGTTRDGLIEDVNSRKEVNDRNRWFVRGQALWDISDNANLRIIADTSRTHEVCCTALQVKVGSTAPAINLLAALRGLTGILPVDAEDRRGAFTPSRSYGEAVEEGGVSAELNADIGSLKFTSVTSTRNWETTRAQDIDFSGMDRAYREGFKLQFETFTQEFRLGGEAGRLNWLAGVFYAKEDTDYTDTVRFGIDAARYPDILAAGLAANFGVPAAFCNPATLTFTACPTIYGSLPGSSPAAAPPIFAALIAPLTQSFVAAGQPLALATANAQSVVGQYSLAIRATAPQPGQGQTAENVKTSTESLAIFTHNEIDLTDRLNLTLGLRYNTETKDLNADLNAVAPGCGVLQNTAPTSIVVNPFTGATAPVGPSFNLLSRQLEATPLGQFLLFACNPVVNTVANGRYVDSREEKEWSGTASLKFDVSDQLMIYGTYSRGYKAGGFNMDRSAFNISPSSTTRPSTRDWQFEPEFVDNIEFGWKWSGLPGRTTVNGAIFRQDIKDYQLNAFSGFNFVNFNAPKVVSQGLELDVVSRPTSWLTLQAGALFNDASFDEDVFISRGCPIGTARCLIVASGAPVSGAADVTLTGSTTLRGQITPTLGWTLYVDGRYMSGYQTQQINRDPVTDQDAFSVFNARAGVGAIDGSWSVELFARNIADTFYYVGAFGVPEQTGTFAIYPGEPRMIGATLRANF